MNAAAPVVVGYDGTADSLAALDWAAHAASLRGASVVVVTVEDPRESPRGVAWPDSYWQEAEEKARKVLAPWAAVEATFVRHGGHLVPRLVESAAGAAMLVVGSHGHSMAGEILRGSVSQSAARHAGVPVVVVRPATNPDARRIVVGADSSEPSHRALQFACETARLTDDTVVVLHAWHPTSIVAGRTYAMPIELDAEPDARAALAAIVRGLRGEYPDVEIEGELYRGTPDTGLVDASASASMVVVGSRDLGVVGQVLIGSVSHYVLHKAHCPIAVVH